MPAVRSTDGKTGSILLYVTDLHFSGQRPVWRIGNYFYDLMAKLRDIGKIVKDRGIPRVIIGGDLTNSPIVSLELGDQIVDEIESWGTPVYVVVGNHDLFGNALETLRRTWLGHIFRRSKIIQKLDVVYDGRVCIYGEHYDDGIEDRLRSPEHSTETAQLFFRLNEEVGSGNKRTERIADKMIECVHAMVVPDKIHPDARQISTKDYCTRADLVLSGDYHPGWPEPIVRMDATTFVNPGAMARMSVAKSDVHRPVRVALVSRTLEIEFLDLPSARPAEEAFDLRTAEADKEWKSELDEAMESMRHVEFKKVDVRSRIEELATAKAVEKNIRQMALDRYDQLSAG